MYTIVIGLTHTIDGGWLDRNWIQVAYQLAWIAFATAWTAVTTYIIMFVST
jgi:Amt family ammonium transporter